MTLPIDREIHQAKALVIDGNPTSRSVMSAQLRDLGVQQVRQVARVQDARSVLEESSFEIVLCELDFEGAPQAGQQLLDELRREQLLPYYTVFMIVTGHATHARVVDAAESTVDGYLLKPYSAAALADRMSEARRRKKSLDAVYKAIQSGQLTQAAQLAEAHYYKRGPYQLYAAQVATELWFRADQPERAVTIYDSVLEEDSLPWVRTGLARVQLTLGELGRARRQLETLIDEMPGYADAHDLLARVLLEQGDLADALDAFRAAAALTPGCMLRQQHAGSLGFYLGSTHEALQWMERSVAMGRKSKLFDALTLAILVMVKHDVNDGKGLALAQRQVSEMRASWPQSSRLRIFDLCGQALLMMQAQRFDEAVALARELAADAMAPYFDLEAATLTLALWARLPANERPPKEWDSLLRTIGMRFATSKATTEVLVGAAAGRPGADENLRNAQHQVTQIAEQALARSMAAQPVQALSTLLDHGQQTGNARLIDMAAVVARRHAKAIGDITPWMERTTGLQRQWCRPLTHIAGIRRSVRTPGGVVLRT